MASGRERAAGASERGPKRRGSENACMHACAHASMHARARRGEEQRKGTRGSGRREEPCGRERGQEPAPQSSTSVPSPPPSTRALGTSPPSLPPPLHRSSALRSPSARGAAGCVPREIRKSPRCRPRVLQIGPSPPPPSGSRVPADLLVSSIDMLTSRSPAGAPSPAMAPPRASPARDGMRRRVAASLCSVAAGAARVSSRDRAAR